MKNSIIILALAFSAISCSTCYECYQQIPLIDANTGDTIDFTRDTEEFCTADASEITERENEGADCQVQ